MQQMPLGLPPQIGDLSNQISGQADPQKFIQLLLDLRQQLHGEINDILVEFDLQNDHSPDTIDSNFILKLQQINLDASQRQLVDKLLDLLINYQEVKFQLEKI